MRGPRPIRGPRRRQGREAGSFVAGRELGEAKVEAKEAANPTIKLADGVRFKRLRDGAGATVAAGDVVDVAYSISSAGGAYMYSRGFGFEKDADGVLDTGDFLRVKLGSQDVPKGIEAALLGMRVSEKRRVELPSGPVGFESSSWRPAPQTRRGKAQITAHFHRADLPKTRRGDDADIPWRRVAATTRPRRGYSVATSRGHDAATTWIFRGDESRRRGSSRSRLAPAGTAASSRATGRRSRRSRRRRSGTLKCGGFGGKAKLILAEPQPAFKIFPFP